MKSIEQSEQKTTVEMMRDTIRGARENIEREFAGEAGNSWAACFKSVLTGINLWLSVAEDEGEIDSEERKRGQEKVKELAKMASSLQDKYPGPGDVPPDEAKENLISQLEDILPA